MEDPTVALARAEVATDSIALSLCPSHPKSSLSLSLPMGRYAASFLSGKESSPCLVLILLKALLLQVLVLEPEVTARCWAEGNTVV